MANYNLYNGINTNEIKTKAKDLKDQVDRAKGNLSSFESSLSDSIWKASSKDTLKKAFKTLNEDVTKEITDALNTAITVAGYIDDYNEAKKNAEDYISKLKSADSEKDAASIPGWESALAEAEANMDTAESNVNTALQG